MKEKVKEKTIEIGRKMVQPVMDLMSNAVMTASVESYKKDWPIKIRSFFRPLVQKAVRSFLKKDLIFDKESIISDEHGSKVLEPKKPYIFASTHSFNEDIAGALGTIDRHAYILIGTKDQVRHNPQMLAAWANGMVFVDRDNEQNKKDSLAKMDVLLNKGISILIYPEGYFNNTESLIIGELFSGIYNLSVSTKTEVVPVASFADPDNNDLHMCYGNPIKLYEYEYKDALKLFRDTLATMRMEQIIKYSVPIKREELREQGDIRLNFLEQRRQEYLKVYWSSKEALMEELDYKKDSKNPKPKELLETFANVKITPQNAHLIASLLNDLEEYRKYDLKEYVKRKGIKK